MAFTQGAPLPDITQTTTRTDTAPAYYTKYLEDLSAAGQGALQRPPGEQIAGYDPLQTQGYGALPAAASAYQPGLTAAGQTAATAAQGLTPERISALMNPYTSQVVNEMERLSQQNVQRNLLPGLKAGFVGSGGLGSQRYAGALGQSMADIQANLTGQQAGALSKGYSEALKAALDEAQLRNQTAQTQATIAGQEQQLGLTGAGALTKGGAERQAYEQARIDAPLKTASNVAALMRGYQLPMQQQEQFVGPKAGLYQTSDLANILGVLSTLGAIKQGTAGGDLTSFIGGGLRSLAPTLTGGLTNAAFNVSNWLSPLPSGSPAAPGEFGVDTLTPD